ncbi:hypothetical protein BKA57DRAFT_469415 [Linnemannia elongata]|nr:hypothetical protein BKA57DRAFT_480315 [Linnemannia elongata]KAH7044363.1 hypothetical protein BKA57DRAFT_469415 [Linnemannia elongata]
MKLSILTVLLASPLCIIAAPWSAAPLTEAPCSKAQGLLGYGCHKGLCWAHCTMGWCYTTKGTPRDRRYVSCEWADECGPDWSCAGPCTI